MFVKEITTLVRLYYLNIFLTHYSFMSHMYSYHKLPILQTYKEVAPITAARFSPRGGLYFYALSYDWSKGHGGNDAMMRRSIMCHPVLESEIKKR